MRDDPSSGQCLRGARSCEDSRAVGAGTIEDDAIGARRAAGVGRTTREDRVLMITLSCIDTETR
jgi:hypothetical protein